MRIKIIRKKLSENFKEQTFGCGFVLGRSEKERKGISRNKKYKHKTKVLNRQAEC